MKSTSRDLPADQSIVKIVKNYQFIDELSLLTLLNHNAGIDQPDEEGITAIHYACTYKDTFLTNLLLQHGGEVYQKDRFGKTPLHYACQALSFNNVRLLLTHGAKVNAQDNAKQTALDCMKISKEACPILKELMREHAFVKRPLDWLKAAIEADEAELVISLNSSLMKTADILAYAIEYQSKNVIQSYARSPLTLAEILHLPDLVRLSSLIDFEHLCKQMEITDHAQELILYASMVAASLDKSPANSPAKIKAMHLNEAIHADDEFALIAHLKLPEKRQYFWSTGEPEAMTKMPKDLRSYVERGNRKEAKKASLA